MKGLLAWCGQRAAWLDANLNFNCLQAGPGPFQFQGLLPVQD